MFDNQTLAALTTKFGLTGPGNVGSRLRNPGPITPKYED